MKTLGFIMYCAVIMYLFYVDTSLTRSIIFLNVLALAGYITTKEE